MQVDGYDIPKGMAIVVGLNVAHLTDPALTASDRELVVGEGNGGKALPRGMSPMEGFNPKVRETCG